MSGDDPNEDSIQITPGEEAKLSLLKTSKTMDVGDTLAFETHRVRPDIYTLLARQTFILGGIAINGYEGMIQGISMPGDGRITSNEAQFIFRRLGEETPQAWFEPLPGNIIGELADIAPLMHPEFLDFHSDEGRKSTAYTEAMALASRRNKAHLRRLVPRYDVEEKIFLALARQITPEGVEEAEHLLNELAYYHGAPGLEGPVHETRGGMTLLKRLREREMIPSSRELPEWLRDLRLDGEHQLARNIYHLMIHRIWEDDQRTPSEEQLIDLVARNRFSGLVPNGHESLFSRVEDEHTIFDLHSDERRFQDALVGEIHKRLVGIDQRDFFDYFTAYSNARTEGAELEDAYQSLLSKFGFSLDELTLATLNTHLMFDATRSRISDSKIFAAADYHASPVMEMHDYYRALTDATMRGVVSYIADVNLALSIWKKDDEESGPEPLLRMSALFYGIRDPIFVEGFYGMFTQDTPARTTVKADNLRGIFQ